MKKNTKIKDIEVDLDMMSIGKIVVDGKDISKRVTGITITAAAGEIPVTQIKIIGPVDVKVKSKLIRCKLK